MRCGVRWRRWRVGCAAGVLAVVGLGACGGGDDATPTSSTTTTTAPDTPARDFSRPGVAVIAHRGASGAAPEHTNAAYTLAIDQGADYIELDVQMTADGELVLLHDPTLDRTARGPATACTGLITEKTMDELAACDMGSWFNEAHPDLADPAFSRQRLLRLADVLDDQGQEIRTYIEVKEPDAQPGMIDALLVVLDEHAPANDDPVLPNVVIQSFSADALQQIHDQRPDLPLVQLVRQGEPTPDGAALDQIATYAVAIGPPKEIADRTLIDAAAERCLDVHPYTVDESAEMGSLLDADVGGIFTNQPGVLRNLLPDAPMDTGLCEAAATAGG